MRFGFRRFLGRHPVVRPPIACFDIGARGGFTADLRPIADSVRALLVEPDRQECSRLAKLTHPWAVADFIPAAVGPEGVQTLNVYARRGCSSFLEADVDLIRLYGRERSFVLDDRIAVPTKPLDQIATDAAATDARYIKIDIQGYEIEALRTGEALLANSVVAIRSEVSFVPLYKNQPLFGDMCAYLGRFGFVPIRFVEMHHWRRDGGPKSARVGQMIHGDALFFKMPEKVPAAARAAAAAIASCYGQIDYCTALTE